MIKEGKALITARLSLWREVATVLRSAVVVAQCRATCPLYNIIIFGLVSEDA